MASFSSPYSVRERSLVEESYIYADFDSMFKRRSASHPASHGRKYSLIPFSDNGFKEGIIARLNGGPYKRCSSLPDMNVSARVDCTVSCVEEGRRLSKTRSVSFHPEIVGVNAAADNDVTKLTELLDKALITVDYETDSGLRMLHYASMTGSLDCLKMLIDYGAEVNCPDGEGISALEYAVRGGFFDCASLLIAAGARGERIVNGSDNFKK